MKDLYFRIGVAGMKIPVQRSVGRGDPDLWIYSWQVGSYAFSARQRRAVEHARRFQTMLRRPFADPLDVGHVITSTRKDGIAAVVGASLGIARVLEAT